MPPLRNIKNAVSEIRFFINFEYKMRTDIL